MRTLLASPLILLPLWALGFLWVWAVRKNTLVTLSATLTLFLLLFITLPGGRAVAKLTPELPTVSQRAACVSDAIREGVWWGEEIPTSCVYRGRPLLR